MQDCFIKKYGSHNYQFDIITIDTVYLRSSNEELIIEKIKQHNSHIIDYLHDRKSRNLNSINHKIDIIAQTRIIYFTLLAVIIGFLIAKNSSKKVGLKDIIYLLITFGIISMYLIEINSQDQLLKSEFNSDLFDSGIKKILGSENYEKTYLLWYDINLENRQSKKLEINDTKTRLLRKLHRAILPSIEQIIYYLCPLFIILILYYLRKK